MPLLRTDSAHPDFIRLTRLLDHELSLANGEAEDFYRQFNGIDRIRNVVLGYRDGQAVGCGAFKPFDAAAVEVKRMYVEPAARGRGLANEILRELETWAAEEGYTAAVLETGRTQTAAIALYQKAGYALVENYGPYIGVENSVCFGKGL